MPIEIIVAVADGHLIGREGKLPWGHLPRDLAHFREVTKGHTVVMGYKTFISIGHILPWRINLVLTNDKDKIAPFAGCVAVSKIETVLERAKSERVFIIGGGIVYDLFLPYAIVVHLTKIEAEFEGDTHFPRLAPDEWRLSGYEFHKPDEENKYPLSFQTWVRMEYIEEKMAA